ncbi:MAG: hypothetical protein FJ151_04500, partial [Euryarchaeota archaeon]|nr:hypothetical protein [Euryarchaeota archaeon]
MKTRIGIIGGFLGAGKTTLATKIAAELKAADKSVAIITNDQGEVLVDTQYAKSMGIDVEEVLRGCFCCRFPDFIRSARQLARISRPDVILAEPVGSCTDLLSTVVAPLKAIYPDEFEVAPLMIVVDGTRLLSDIIDPQTPGEYLRRHQIEEAEIVVLSKTDIIPKESLDNLVEIIGKINSRARVVLYSAVNGIGIDTILANVVSSEVSSNRPVQIDYDIYARAEAELGWYNGSYRFDLKERTDTYQLAIEMLRGIAENYEAGEIAHVKLILNSESNAMKMSLIYQDVSVDGVKGSRYGSGTVAMTLNARVVSSPKKLRDVVRQSVDTSLSLFGLSLREAEDSSFSP